MISRILNLTIILIFLFLLFQCSPNTKDQEMSSENLQIEQLVPQPSLKNETDSLKEKVDVENWVKTTSKDFYLENLKEKRLSNDEKELRIWSEQSQGTILNCLVIHKSVEKWQAILYSVHVIGELGEYEKTPQGKNLVHKKILTDPTSGWKNINNYLIQQGIKTPLSFSWDTNQELIIEDEGSVTLEIKQGDNYDLVSYGEFTESTDGKTIVRVCNYLENEFRVKIGCKN